MKQEGATHRLNPQAWTTPTPLIAESESGGKDLIIRLSVDLLAEMNG